MTRALQEEPVQIIINGRAAMTLMTSADVIQKIWLSIISTQNALWKPMQMLFPCIQMGHRSSVVTSKPFGILLSRKTVLAGCGGASSFLDSGKLEQVSSGFTLSQEEIRRSLDQLPQSHWYRSWLFAKDGTLLATEEDITSQNVLDRLTIVDFPAALHYRTAT